MISVQSPQRRLNGNNILAIIVAIILFIGCSSTRSSTGSTPVLLESKKQENLAEKKPNTLVVDTIKWIVTDEAEVPPISADLATEEVLPFQEEYKNDYRVALMLPFRLSGRTIDDMSDYNQKFAHFYAGYKMAIGGEDWIQTNTYHTNRNGDNVKNTLRTINSNTDIIIGPYDKNTTLPIVAEYGRENRIPVISPWTASTRTTKNNLFFLQLTPNLSEYWSAILKDATKNFDRSKIRIITNQDGSDRGMVRFIQRLNEEKSGLPISEPLKEFPVSVDSLLYGDSLVFETVFEEEVEAFILPHYNTNSHDEFIYQTLRKINAEKEHRKPLVYVMPQAINSDRVDLNILNNLDLKICDYRFYDKRDIRYLNFKKEYYELYGRLPNDDAYYGYDVAKFVAYGLKKYGKYFHYYIKEEKVPLGQMSISVSPYNNDDDELLYLMNDHLDIFEFDEGYYQLKSVD